MNKNGPILVIEDDPDDSEVYGEIFQKLELLNDVIYFNKHLKSDWYKSFCIPHEIGHHRLHH